MTIFGTIYDNTTKVGIPGASISVVDASGNSLGSGIAADNTGWFQLISPLLDTGNKIWISSVGYTSAIVDPNIFVASMGLGLDPTSANLAAVVVTPAGATNYTPYLVGGGILAALLLFTGKKKKGHSMGALNPSTQTLLIGGGVVLVGGYFLVKALPSLNPFPAATNPVDVTATMNAQATALAQAKASGKAATYSADQYTGWANDIYKLGTSATTVDQNSQSAIVEDVTNANNMVDLQSLISAFGTKQAGGTMCNLFNMYCDTYDLPSFLKAVLDTAHLGNINLYLQDAGINYTF